MAQDFTLKLITERAGGGDPIIRERRVPGPTVPVYVISVAAELTGLHPQTLRQYDRAGLVSPGRTGGGGRRYSLRDLEQQVAALRARNAELRERNNELRAALEQTLNALNERRPRLPAVRQPRPMPPAPFDR